MNRLLRIGGVVLVLGTLVLASRLWSETKPPAAPNSRVALINLAQVIKHYQKVVAFQPDTKGLLQPYQDKAKILQTQIETHSKELAQADLPADKREKLEKTLRNFQRQLE